MSEATGARHGDDTGNPAPSGRDEDAELHARVRALFHELYELPPDERESRLEKAPARVREEVAELLANVERADSLEDSRLGELGDVLLAEDDRAVAGIPARIGEYVVLGKLGEGGMGVVYAARPAGGGEAVAIKVIQAGANAERLSSRFRREIQVLEQLRHPGIAAFHGTGHAPVRTAAGEATLPFLVMELVDGDALLEHVEHRGSTDRERIELAVRICAALHHAHERGIVHRDLKPANILVERGGDDPVGQPKILDFGVALSADTDLATITATQTGALVGTLPYMSPEQVDGSGRTVDRRSDVYSVGVLTFELLSGRLPYDVRDRPLIEAARVIAEDEPTRLGSVARRYKGALEAIVRKALEKDRAHRYPSAAALGDDLERFLRGDSVLARRAPLGRELAKFARRHRVFFATAIGVLVALSLGLVSSIRFAMGEQEARRTAEESLYRSKVRAAAGAIADGDVGLAELELAQAPEHLRGWEWGLLASRLDASVRQFSIGREFAAGRRLAEYVLFDPSGGVLYVHDQKGNTCFRWDMATGEPSEFPLDEPAAVDSSATRLAQIADGVLLLSSFPDRQRLASIPLPPDLEPRWQGLSFAGERHLALKTNAGVFMTTCGQDELGEPFEPDPYGADAWSTDATNRWIASVSKQSGLLITDRGTGESWSLDASTGSQERWQWVQVSPDGTRVAGLSHIGRMFGWALSESEGPMLAWRREALSKEARVLAISPDSSRLVAAGEFLDVLDARTGERLQTLSGHRAPVQALGFSRDGRRLASVDKEGGVRVRQLDGDPQVLRAGNYVYAAEPDPSGRRVCVGTANGELIALDASSSVEIGRARLFDGAITSVSFDGGGEHCAVGGVLQPGGRTFSSLVLDTATGAVLWLRRHERGSGRLATAFSPDGRSVVVAGTRGFVAVSDTVTGELRIEATPVERQRGIVPALAVHPRTGQILCGADGAVDVYDPETLAHSLRFANDGGLVMGVALSADGGRVATGSADHAIRVWDFRSDVLLAELVGHAQPVLSVCWSPDGSKLFSGSRDATVKVWDTRRWADVAALTDHTDYVFSVRVSPDGETLLSCGGDGTARIWRAETRSERWEAQLLYRRVAERMAPVVDELLAGSSGPAGAAEAIRRSKKMSEREREVALQLLLGRGLHGQDG